MNVINELLELFKDVPLNATSINLAERNLTDFDLIGSSLAQFKHLEELDVSSNQITDVFRNTQPYFVLQSLTSLNICENPIEDVGKAIQHIHQVFPQITDLKINLYEEADVDFIINHIPDLQTLNGLPVEREELEALQESPQSHPQPSPPEEDALSSKYFSKVAEGEDSFKKKPKEDVKSLTEQIQARVKGGVPQQQNFGRPRFIEKKGKESQQQRVTEQDEGGEEGVEEGAEELDLNPQELEQIALLYDQIRELFKGVNMQYDKKLALEFDNHLKTVMLNLSNALRNRDLSVREKNAEVLKSKFFLFDVCFEKAVQFLALSEPQHPAVRVFEQIRQGTCANFVFLSEQVSIHLEQLQQELGKRNVAMMRGKEPTERRQEGRQEVKQDGKGNLDKQMKQQLVEQRQQSDQETKSLKEYIKHLEERLEEQQQAHEQSQQEKEELLSQIQSLEEENKKCVETLIKHSKFGPEPPVKKFQQESSRQLMDQSQDDQAVSPGVLSPLKAQQEIESARKEPLALNKAHLNKLFPMQPPKDLKKGKMKYLNSSTFSQVAQARHLSLKQMKDLILDIYASKQRHDEKNQLNKLPRETMEQFMYTYLNQRYGLKQLIIEWAGAIINGIKQYSKLDNDVCVFGKVLRNDVEEDFRFVQAHVKETVHGLLKMLVKERFPLKIEGEINRMIEEIIGDRTVVEGIYWVKIIERMYADQDILVLQQRIRESARMRYQQEVEREILTKSGKNKARMTREEQIQLQNKLNDSQASQGKLYFSDFLKNILDFQLREHERFLKPFILLFRCVDLDGNGIVDENQFQDLIGKMGLGVSQEDLRYFLQLLDPFNTQMITFSEIVSLFQSHQVCEEQRLSDGSIVEKKVSLLERFSKFSP